MANKINHGAKPTTPTIPTPNLVQAKEPKILVKA
jgi:hypothetical protein